MEGSRQSPEAPIVGDSMAAKKPTETREMPHSPRAAGPAVRPAARPEGAAGDLDALWDVRDVARYLKLPTSAIYKMTARAAAVHVPHIRIGGALRFRRAEVDRWLAALTVTNVDRLAKVRERALEVPHGHDP